MRQTRVSLFFAATTAALLLTACGNDEKSVPVRSVSMGERVLLGHITYTVFETQWLTHIGVGPEARVPQHRFFLVRLSAVNSGSGDVSVPAFILQDDSGNTYNELTDGAGVPQWIGYLRTVKPAEAAQGNALFDAPPKHYKLKVQDEDGERTALVDIPLNFGAEAPDIVPNPEKK
jgi:hypothetical protein